MDILIYLVPITIILGLIGLVAFLWTVKTKQYEDLEGAANRILFDEDKIEEKNEGQGKENNKNN